MLFNEIIVRNIPNCGTYRNFKVQETYKIPNRVDQKRISAHHIIFKFSYVEAKERIFKAAREKFQCTYKSKRIKIISDLSEGIRKPEKHKMTYLKPCA
jgi:hypothetical protein